jgi:single-stranded-DNA-specific exonuclease
MRRRDHVGHTALMDVSRLNGPPEAWHLGFMLGPRINAGAGSGAPIRREVATGRRCLRKQPDRCRARSVNTERRVIEQMAEAQAEAEALASLGLGDKGAVIVTASEGGIPAWSALSRHA